MSRKKRYNNKKSSNESFNILMVPIIIILSLMPLVVRAKVINYDTSSLMWYSGDSYQMVDIFNYYKSSILIATASIMLLILVFQTIRNKDNSIIKTNLIPLAYCLCVIIATIGSVSVYYSLKGYINHLENMWVLLSYIILFIYVKKNITSSTDFMTLTKFWMISIGLLTIIGLTQFFNTDFYRTTLGLSLIVPAALQPYISNTEFTLFANNVIYQSLYHYNYVSFYSAMAFPFFLTLFINSSNKKYKYLYLLTAVLCLFNLIGSQGRNGFFGIFAGLVIILLFEGKRILLSKYTWITLLSIIVVTLIISTTTETSIEGRIKDTFTDVFQTTDYALNSIITDDNSIIIDHDDFMVTATRVSEDSYTFSDEDGNPIPFKQDAASIQLIPSDLSNNLYDSLEIQLMTYEDEDVLAISIDNYTWNFEELDGTFYYLNSAAKTVTLDEVDHIGFEGIERSGSARGYIWSRTLPIILDHPLFGTGPDTFTLSFPQADYVGKYQAYETYTPIVDKPHNIFLNYAVHTGLISLIAILAIWFVSYYNTFKNHFHTASSSRGTYYAYSIASIASMTGYIIAGLFNDTNLHVTPIFWIIVGINYAANRTLNP